MSKQRICRFWEIRTRFCTFIQSIEKGPIPHFNFMLNVPKTAMIFLQMQEIYICNGFHVWRWLSGFSKFAQSFSPRQTFCIFAYSDWMVTLLSLHRPNSLYFPFLANFTNSSNVRKTHVTLYITIRKNIKRIHQIHLATIPPFFVKKFTT